LLLWEVGVANSSAWTQWLSFNANNLSWIALVVGGVLFTDLLMRL